VTPRRTQRVPGRRGAARRVLRAPALVSLMSASAPAQSEFATAVLDFAPAPGQFVNNASFNEPADALGAPSGGGTETPNNASVVSLGGFGGALTLGFNHTVLDDPRNRYGIDAIVFGNAAYVSDNELRRFAEAGVIEISLDANGNGLADDPWYVIAGPAITAAPIDQLEAQLWDDDPDTPTPPSNLAWYPSQTFYPGRPASYETMTYRVPGALEVPIVELPIGSTHEAWRALADFTPVSVLGDLDGDNLVDDPGAVPEVFYTRPDNPYLVGVTPGSAGGDGFDIAWAVDPLTGEPARLPGFDFLRVSTGGNALLGFLGELSTEIDGASDARPHEAAFDLTGDGACGIEDIYAWHAGSGADLSGEGTVDATDSAMLERCARFGEASDVSEGSR